MAFEHEEQMPPETERRRKKPARPKTSALTMVAIGLVAVVVALVVAVVGIILLQSPSKLIEQQLAEQVRSATGRELTVAGGSSITFWPSIGVAFDDIRLSAPPGMDGPETVRAARLGTNIAVWPLLSGQAVVESITLDRPVIDLRIDEQGRASWRFGARSEALPRVKYAQADATPTDAGLRISRPFATALPELVANLERLKLNGLTIADGTVFYSDARSGTAERIDNIELSLDRFDVDAPSELSGSLTARDSRVTLRGKVGALRRLADDQKMDVSLQVASDQTEASLEGVVDFADAGTFEGPLKATASSLTALARRFGLELPRADELGAASIEGNVTLSSKRLVVRQARMAVGDMSAEGAISVDIAAATPFIEADLSTAGVIDIDQIAGVFKAARTDSTGLGADAVSSGSRSAYEPQADSEPLPRANDDADGWSTVPIETALLEAVNFDANLALAGVKVRGLQIGRADARARLNDGVFRTDIASMQLYEGTGRGSVRAAKDPAGLSIGADIKLTGVSVRPLLRDYSEFDSLAGRGDIDLKLDSRGRHEAELVSGTDGSVAIEFVDGAIVGWNVAKILRGLTQGQISDLDRIATEETDFSELNATFVIRSGVAETQDLQLMSPLVRMSGKGRILAPTRELDLLLRPRLVASLEGQGASAGAQGEGDGLEIPVRVSGSWDDPTVDAQLGDLFSDPDKVGRAVDNIRRQLEGKSVGEVIDELTGKNGGGGAKKLLEGLFGGGN